jgi:hypothetical protein
MRTDDGGASIAVVLRLSADMQGSEETGAAESSSSMPPAGFEYPKNYSGRQQIRRITLLADAALELSP